MRTIIIAVVLMGLAAVAGSIIVGSRSFDGVVVDKPYETGLAWDKVKHENAATGWQADVRESRLAEGNSELVLSVRDAAGHALQGAEVSITISRPSTKTYDRTYKAVQAADGLYKVPVLFPLYGYWDLKISILKEGKHSGFGKRIFAEKGTIKKIADLEVALDISPEPVKAMEELLFSLSVKGGRLDDILLLDLAMPGMYMGGNKVALRKADDGRYYGKGIIPRCPSGKQLWSATIDIPRKGKVEFLFDVIY
jgi:nitrogen fixation protein FixH